MQLSQKEKMFLQDLKADEEICVLKYRSYAQQAHDKQLSQLFNKLSNEEQKHYDTINQFLQGGQPNSGQGQSGQQQGMQSGQQQGMQSGQQQGMQSGQQQQGMQSGQQQGMQSGQYSMLAQGMQSNQQSGQQNMQQKSQGQNSNLNDSDKNLLQDMLMTEKHVSSSYNTSVFEASDSTLRQELQHIQKDEQSHGEQIYQYMSSHGMYQVQ